MTDWERVVIGSTHELCAAVLMLMQMRGGLMHEDTAALMRAVALLAEARERFAAQLRSGTIVITEPIATAAPIVVH